MAHTAMASCLKRGDNSELPSSTTSLRNPKLKSFITSMSEQKKQLHTEYCIERCRGHPKLSDEDIQKMIPGRKATQQTKEEKKYTVNFKYQTKFDDVETDSDSEIRQTSSACIRRIPSEAETDKPKATYRHPVLKLNKGRSSSSDEDADDGTPDFVMKPKRICQIASRPFNDLNLWRRCSSLQMRNSVRYVAMKSKIKVNVVVFYPDHNIEQVQLLAELMGGFCPEMFISTETGHPVETVLNADALKMRSIFNESKIQMLIRKGVAEQLVQYGDTIMVTSSFTLAVSVHAELKVFAIMKTESLVFDFPHHVLVTSESFPDLVAGLADIIDHVTGIELAMNARDFGYYKVPASLYFPVSLIQYSQHAKKFTGLY